VLGGGNVKAGVALVGGDLLPGPPGKLAAGGSGPADSLGESVVYASTSGWKHLNAAQTGFERPPAPER
jgi:hypothetical protein